MPLADAADTSARVSTGGLSRYKSGHWGLVTGTFFNKSEQPRQLSAVVTPGGRSGAQYVRSLVVPPQMSRRSSWPVYLEEGLTDAFQFDVVVLEGDADSQQIKGISGGEFTDNFISPNAAGRRDPSGVPGRAGYSGVLSTRTESDRDRSMVDRMVAKLRKQAGLLPMQAFLDPEDISGYPESLDALDQLIISTPDLLRYPEACDAVRAWIQRGGCALILLDQCGQDSAAAITGTALPFTVVDSTTPMSLSLRHDAGMSHPGIGDSSHQREFDEPITLVRARFESGTVHWSVQGWPVLVDQQFGNGSILMATVSPEVFLSGRDDDSLGAVADHIQDRMFRTQPEQPLLNADVLSAAAERRIGYFIPDRGFAALVLIVFTCCLGVLGWTAFRRQRPALLLVLLPLLSAGAAMPGILKGVASRGVAPPTLIESRVAHLAAGQAVLATDGVATVYNPSVVVSDMALSGGTLVRPRKPGAGPQRFVWHDMGEAEWDGFSQPAGTSSYAERAMIRLDEPLKAVAAFKAEQVEISISNAETLQPEDVIVASSSPDRMAVRLLQPGRYVTSAADVLAPNEVSGETLLSQEQILHAELYNTLFAGTNRLSPFPTEPTVLFWTESLAPAVQLTESDYRNASMTVVTVPLQIAVPDADVQITIPTTFLPYEAIAGPDGSVSSAFSNRQARWIERKRGGYTMLRFRLPEACCPFYFDSADVQLRILAGSRTVRVQSGSRGEPVDVTTLESPVGSFTIPVSADVLNSDSDGCSVIVGISVADLDDLDPEKLNAEQDDNWKIERVLLTVRGHRMARP
ncbi:MAG: hypothetical protein RIK87_17585 [Fuerstiella sp.]